MEDPRTLLSSIEQASQTRTGFLLEAITAENAEQSLQNIDL